MRIFVAALLLLLPVSALADTSCALDRLASLPLQIPDNGAPQAMVAVGSETMPFIFDTRAPVSIVYYGAVQRLGLPNEMNRENPIDIDGAKPNGWTRVPQIMAGRIRLTDEGFAVVPNGSDGTKGNPAGVFGSAFLRNYDVEFDPAGHKLSIYSQDHCEGKVVYWANSYNRSPLHVYRDGQLEVDVEVDGELLHALLATGISGSVIDERVARRHFGVKASDGELPPDTPIVDLNGTALPVYRNDFKTFKFGDLTIHNPRIGITDLRSFWNTADGHIRYDGVPDMLIGMNFLRHLHLYLAYREDAMYYTVAQ